MPMNYKDYSPEWKKLSKSIIKGRANDQCELCFVYNGEKGYRLKSGEFIEVGQKCTKATHNGRFVKIIKIVLTVHHIDFDNKNDDPLNLLALCQRCHLRLDIAKKIKNQKAKKVKGQLELEEG